MKRQILRCVILMFIILFTFKNLLAQEVRFPAVSGHFYPRERTELSHTVKKFLKNAELCISEKELVCLVAPHAGYSFSGQVAGHAYKQLEGRKIDTVILIGPSHYVRFPGVSVGNFSVYRTPLGDVKVNTMLAEKLMASEESIIFYRRAHKKEHSIEVQLPFLQMVLNDFRILPILIGDASHDTCEKLARALMKITEGRKVLFIASTDLSHFHSYEEAVQIDKRTIGGIRKLDSVSFLKEVKRGKYELCGAGSATTIMILAHALGARNSLLLQYTNSGDIPDIGNRSMVVGYTAIAFIR